ncbi:MAG: transcription termination/antitermination protein NusG [Alphaproteobacteria bacterium]|nr:MAG: transcription termination/antitermination protein NusG [Alphaproteobacteria bacterium]
MSDFKWYAVHIYSGFEEKLIEEIWANAKKAKLDKYIKEIYVPKEKIARVVRGKKVSKERSSFSGYIFIKAVLIDHLHNLIKNTERVVDFLSTASNVPIVVSEAEITKIKAKSEESLTKEDVDTFELGELIKMTDGAFSGFNGVIKEVLEDGHKFKIEVTIFGRPVMIDLAKESVQKVSA